MHQLRHHNVLSYTDFHVFWHWPFFEKPRNWIPYALPLYYHVQVVYLEWPKIWMNSWFSTGKIFNNYKNNSYSTTFWYEDNHKPCKTHQPLIWTKAAEIFWCSKHDFHWGSFRMFLSLKKSFLACLNHNMAFNILSIKSWHNVQLTTSYKKK